MYRESYRGEGKYKFTYGGEGKYKFTYSGEGKYKFTCQHGQQECIPNLIKAKGVGVNFHHKVYTEVQLQWGILFRPFSI